MSTFDSTTSSATISLNSIHISYCLRATSHTPSPISFTAPPLFLGLVRDLIKPKPPSSRPPIPDTVRADNNSIISAV